MLNFRKIRLDVRALLRENRVNHAPVPVEDIAQNLGLEVRYAPYDGDISGALIRDRGDVYIAVNSTDHPNRQRFTIAHEIAHFLLHRGMKLHVDRDFRVNLRDGRSSKGVDQDEMEANRFAAELLMPTDLISSDVQDCRDIDQDAVSELADLYMVSVQAMKIRLGNLGIFVPD